MKKPRRISPEGLEVKMLAAMRLKVDETGRISEREAGRIAAKLTLQHFRKEEGGLTPQEVTAGKMCGKSAMCEINNVFVKEEPPGTIQALPALNCPKGSCQRHGACMYLNAHWCPHSRPPE